MTPAALVLARDANPDATAAAAALWKAIVGDSAADPVIPERVKAVHAGAALDLVSAHVGADTDVPDDSLREAVVRTGSYLAHSRPLLGFAGSLGDGLPDGDPRTGGYSALRRSGAMALLTPYTVKRAGAI